MSTPRGFRGVYQAAAPVAAAGAGVDRLVVPAPAALAAGVAMPRAGRTRRPRGTHLLPAGVAHNPGPRGR